MPSPNYSSRGGAGVRLIVLHTAEGARTIESLGSFFANSNSQVSSQVGADDQLGKVGEYVSRSNKAWTQAEFNPVATSIELCGFASWTTGQWKNEHHNMLANCAAWIAEEAAHFAIPITRLSASGAQGSGRGVCQHVDLGSRGGGHHDCGTGFPMDYVLDMARGNVPAPRPPEEEIMAVACGTQGNGLPFVVYERDDGNLFYTWQGKDGKWHGEGNGWAAGLMHFAKKPG
jgi:hypothetical protein